MQEYFHIEHRRDPLRGKTTDLLPGVHQIQIESAKTHAILERLGRETAALDALLVCYHGAGRSKNNARNIISAHEQIFGDRAQVLRVGYVGLEELEVKVLARDRMPSNDAGKRRLDEFVTSMGYQLAQAPVIGMYVNEGQLDNSFQRALYKAILQNAPGRIWDMNHEHAIPKLATFLGNG